MKTKNTKGAGRAVRQVIVSIFFFGVIFPAAVGAEPPGKKRVEMTPGPRMIRAVEALADDILAARDLLKLSPEQEE